jgi:hypothetical protein
MHTAESLLGNPPSSPDKITIGDEVIWELLLAKLREDLIVVTGDGTTKRTCRYSGMNMSRKRKANYCSLPKG